MHTGGLFVDKKGCKNTKHNTKIKLPIQNTVESQLFPLMKTMVCCCWSVSQGCAMLYFANSDQNS
jgi:hypothetical protein